MRFAACLLLLALLVPGGKIVTGAQSGTQGTAPADTHPDFSGTWSLDTNLSDDLSRVDFGGGQESDRRTGRGGGSGGGRRGSRGGFGAPGSGDTSTRLEKSRLEDLINELKKGFALLVVSHHEPTFVINDGLDFTQFFRTNGVMDEHPFSSGPITSTTRWEGSRLVTEYALSSRQKLTCTYTVLPATKQMVLRVRLDAGTWQPPARELKLVYNLKPPDPKRSQG